MNQQEFLAYIDQIHTQITKIATDNGYAILLAASISDQTNATETIGSTNMADDDTFRSLARQSAYFDLLSQSS